MTLLGAQVFQMGVAAATAAASVGVAGMDLSLDEMIESRRTSARQQNPRPKSVTKTVSNTDKSIATSRAKRNAAMAARRGLQTDTKPTSMQVEQEIKKQVSKTAVAKARTVTKRPSKPSAVSGGKPSTRRPMKANTGTSMFKASGADKAAARKERRETIKQGKVAAAILKPPSKKAVTAAVNAMQTAGFTIPQGQQLVISFAPIPGTAAATVKGPNAPKSPPKNQSNNNKTTGGKNSNTGKSTINNSSNRGNNRNNNRPRPPKNN